MAVRTLRTAAGDRLEVGVTGRFGQDDRAVRLRAGEHTSLQPDEARRLGVLLIEGALAAERKRRT